MSHNLSRQLGLTKQAVTSRGGAVAAQNQKAADIGAGVLATGGNAVDAAITTAFALAALEPWMSGLGGIGHMLVWDARQRRAHAIDFGAISARGLDPADYPLTGRAGLDLFGWPEVADDRNIVGYPSIAVPGQPEGMRAAHERFATRRWPELLEPAIALAAEGIAADWFATLVIANAAAPLARFPASAAWFLPDGRPPAIGWDGALPRLKNAALAATLSTLSARGARDLYEGGLAAALAADLAVGGSRIDMTDLANVRARVTEPLDVVHAGKRLRMPAGLTAGPTLADALSRIAGHLGDALDAGAVVAHALALSRASAVRLDTLGETRTAAECTTHLSVIDRDGNMVALTQTLLSLFGSKVVLPETGILMNNGINWFDPRPGRPNALGPGKRPLSNMLPVLGFAGEEPWLAIGASGGRRILPAVFQLISFQADFGLGLEAAFHHPRIDTSVAGEVAVDPLIAPETRTALAQHFSVSERARVPYPLPYACPIAVAVEGGERIALTEVSQPWAGAAAG
ncbi:MAG TPA: gamma-glutamyltransferase [Xanthobacteraceae bacterium]|nr:gamma-glutamyltransferase [Xanthobacteraceae bacterium]